jgi:hypothetical protein
MKQQFSLHCQWFRAVRESRIMAPMSREGGIGDGKGRKVAFQDEAHEAVDCH